MKKLNKSVLILVIVMTVLSFTNLFNINVNGEPLKLAGLSVIIGIIAFFTTRKTNGSKAEGLEIRTFLRCLKDKKVILLLFMPILMDILCLLIAKFYLPEYLEHLNSRTNFLDPAELSKLIFELLVLALGEEIAWRAFFQKQTSKIMPFIPSLLISSILFSLGHFNFGNTAIVLYDLVFVFLDSIFYGLVFRKTDNAWCSGFAHFLANLLSIFLLNWFL